jgi:hypothetical protein
MTAMAFGHYARPRLTAFSSAERSAMKPKPFEIFFCSHASPDSREHWIYMMKIGQDELTFTGHARRALIMLHAPGLLHELKAAFELLLRVLDHQRDGKPLPMRTAVGHAAMDAWNIIDLAEGRKTEGTRFYPPPDSA